MNRFLLKRHATIQMFIDELQIIHLANWKSGIFLFVHDFILSDMATSWEHVYNQHGDFDGFLRIIYTCKENTFGSTSDNIPPGFFTNGIQVFPPAERKKM